MTKKFLVNSLKNGVAQIQCATPVYYLVNPGGRVEPPCPPKPGGRVPLPPPKPGGLPLPPNPGGETDGGRAMGRGGGGGIGRSTGR